MSITLTGREIYDLAVFAGFEIQHPGHEVHDEGPDEFETEYTIYDCPAEGVRDDENSPPERYRYVAVLSEYPEEGCHPLGEALPPIGSNEEESE